MARGTKKYAAVSFTDIVGFSKMAGKDEALALELLDEHQDIVRPLITQFKGREVKTIGDAFMVEFAHPREAVEWAVAVQEAMHARNGAVPADRSVLIRIGIHAGDVVQRGDDLFGDGVNIAARVEPQAPHGGVAISGAVHDAVHGQVPLAFMAMEARTLKNIDRQIALFRIVMPWEDAKKSAQAAIEATMAMFAEAEPAPPVVPAESEGPSMLRVAVLPLVNVTGDPGDEFIPSAIQNDLLGALGTLPDLMITARDSMARFTAANRDPVAVARDLKAGLILTGSAGIGAGKLRLTLDCMAAPQGESLWQEEFSAPLDDVANLYADIVARVAETVGVDLPDPIRKQVKRRLPTTPLGFLSHLRGWYQLSLGNLESFQRAQGYFKASLQQDDHHALSMVGMAESYTAIGLLGRTPPVQQMTYLLPGASEATTQALVQDPLLPEAHAARGRMLATYTYDFTGAQQHLRRALRGDDGPSGTHMWLALTLLATDRIEEAREQIRHAHAGDPLSVDILCAEALIDYVTGNFKESADAAEKAIALDGRNWHSLLLAGLASTSLGNHTAAEKVLTHCVERAERHPLAIAALGHCLAASGQKSGMVRLLTEVQDAARSRYVPALALAILHLVMGQQDAALEHLEKAADEQNWLAFLHRSPLFDPLKADGRFRTILEDAGVIAGAD